MQGLTTVERPKRKLGKDAGRTSPETHCGRYIAFVSRRPADEPEDQANDEIAGIVRAACEVEAVRPASADGPSPTRRDRHSLSTLSLSKVLVLASLRIPIVPDRGGGELHRMSDTGFRPIDPRDGSHRTFRFHGADRAAYLRPRHYRRRTSP
jgi:hypothetical protein